MGNYIGKLPKNLTDEEKNIERNKINAADKQSKQVLSETSQLIRQNSMLKLMLGDDSFINVNLIDESTLEKNGNFKPAGGMIIQFGEFLSNIDTNQPIEFYEPFPNMCLGVVPAGVLDTGYDGDYAFSFNSITKSGCNANRDDTKDNSQSDSGNGFIAKYLAFGF